MKNLTQERLREVLSYDPVTGSFTWIHLHHRNRKTNEAGWKHAGYVRIKIDHVVYRAHRLAWLYVYGYWPENEIDHIDGDRGNNSILNLRDVTKAENLQNQRQANRNNGHGFMGVTRVTNSKRKPWQAQIRAFGKHTYLGCFATPEEAHAAYLAAKAKLHPSFPHKDRINVKARQGL